MNTQQMINTHPKASDLDANALTTCINACYECAQSCTSCADACLSEDKVQNLRRCIRLNLDCADICDATGRVLSRQTEPNWDVVRSQVEALARACRVCGDECERHADEHEHCRVCMEACRRCEESCNNLLSQLQGVARA